MKKAVSYGIFAVCLVLSYQAWGNAQLDPETEALSIEAACRGECTVLRERPNFTRTDPLRRRYEWRTSLGQRTVTCTRQLIFFGDWSCESQEGRIGNF